MTEKNKDTPPEEGVKKPQEEVVYLKKKDYEDFLKKIKDNETIAQRKISFLNHENKEKNGSRIKWTINGVCLGIALFFSLDAFWLYWKMSMAQPTIVMYRMVFGLLGAFAGCYLGTLWLYRKDAIWKMLRVPFVYRYIIDGHFIFPQPIKTTKSGFLEGNTQATNPEPNKQFLQNGQPAHFYLEGYADPLALEGSLLKFELGANTVNSRRLKAIVEDTVLNRLSRKIEKKEAILLVLAGACIVVLILAILKYQMDTMTLLKAIPGQIEGVTKVIGQVAIRPTPPPTTPIPLAP